MIKIHRVSAYGLVMAIILKINEPWIHLLSIFILMVKHEPVDVCVCVCGKPVNLFVC